MDDRGDLSRGVRRIPRRRSLTGLIIPSAVDPPEGEAGKGHGVKVERLFPDKIALRLDESEQVDMVLGDDARDHVSRRTFYRWREVGKAPQGIRLPNGELRIYRSDLDAWLESLRSAA
jgi:hypothetical protein